jgi:hypothetical protein
VNEPWIVDDGICDICDEAALPFEYGTQPGPYCVGHSAEVSTEIFHEDYSIDAHGERADEERIACQHLACGDRCVTFYCKEVPMPRIMEVDDAMAGATNSEELCTGHAVEEYFSAYLPTMADLIELNKLEMLEHTRAAEDEDCDD